MTQDCIQPNSPQLWKYPRLLASSLYPGLSLDEITAKVIEFAQTYDDTSCFIRFIPDLMQTVLIEAESKPLKPWDKRHNICGLAFEANGAASNWFCVHDTHSNEALLIWLIHLCYYDPTDDSQYGGGFAVACAGIARYCLSSKRPEIKKVLHKAIEDILVAYPLADEYPEVMLANIAICISLDVQDNGFGIMRKRIQSNKVPDYMRKNLQGRKVTDYLKSVFEMELDLYGSWWNSMNWKERMDISVKDIVRDKLQLIVDFLDEKI